MGAGSGREGGVIYNANLSQVTTQTRGSQVFEIQKGSIDRAKVIKNSARQVTP
jgi:hypothetical protein